jgi:hypothetical protein
MKDLILKYFTYPLYAKTIYLSKYIRIFCDGGQPLFYYFPKIWGYPMYDKYWEMKGFCVQWLGRQIFFSFGKDVNGLYKDCGHE